MLDNGQRMLVVFPVAVHYQEDGEWKEIDNTLKPQESGDETVYQNNAGIWEVRLPEKLDASSAVEVEKDGYILKFELDGSLSSTDNIEASDTENSTESFDMPQSDSATADVSTIPDSGTASPLPDGGEVVQVNESVFAMSQINSATAVSYTHLNQSDVRAAVWVILQPENSCLHVHLVALKVDYTVLSAVSAALVADGYAAVAVAA